MSCGTCTNLRPIVRGDSCNIKREKIEEVRIYCPEDVTETIGPSTDCTVGFVSNLVPLVPLATPMIAIDVLNPEDLDELNDFTFDRDADYGEDNWSFTPLKVKVYIPDHQCTLDSLKGQDVAIVYKISNRDGDYVWRRLFMKLSTVSGGLVQGYELTFDTLSPDDESKPLFVSIATAEATTIAIDAMTQFA